MSYTTGVPQGTDNPGATSRQQFLFNFNKIASLIATNHVAFNLSGEGKHKFMQMPFQSAAPSTGTNEGALYTKGAAGSTNLFYREDSTSGAAELQMTNTTASTSGNNSSWDMADGLRLRLGTIPSGSSPQIVTFNTSLTNSPITVLVTPIGVAATTTNWNVDNVTNTGFRLNAQTGSINGIFYYLAIGSG